MKLLHMAMFSGVFVAAVLFKCAWPCVRCLEGQRSGSSLFSLFVERAAAAGLHHFAEIYSRDLYWWGAKKPSYRKCIHHRVSSFCLLQSKPSAFSGQEAALEWRSCSGGRGSWAMLRVWYFVLDWILLLPYEHDMETARVHCWFLFTPSDWLRSWCRSSARAGSGWLKYILTWCCGPVKGGMDGC